MSRLTLVELRSLWSVWEVGCSITFSESLCNGHGEFPGPYCLYHCVCVVLKCIYWFMGQCRHIHYYNILYVICDSFGCYKKHWFILLKENWFELPMLWTTIFECLASRPTQSDGRSLHPGSVRIYENLWEFVKMKPFSGKCEFWCVV